MSIIVDESTLLTRSYAACYSMAVYEMKIENHCTKFVAGGKELLLKEALPPFF